MLGDFKVWAMIPVTDLDRAMKFYGKVLGKTVNGIATMGTEKVCWFKDSEGNILCPHETVKK